MTFPRLPRTAAAPLSVLTASALTLGALSTAAIAAAAPGVPPSLVATDPTIAQPASDPLYTPPTEIPGTPGTLIRSQQASHPLDVAARADKILFTSTTQDGVPSPPRERSSNRRAPGPVPGRPPPSSSRPAPAGPGTPASPRARTTSSAPPPGTPGPLTNR